MHRALHTLDAPSVPWCMLQYYILGYSRSGGHPPKDNDAFPPILNFPLFSKLFRVWETFPTFHKTNLCFIHETF